MTTGKRTYLRTHPWITFEVNSAKFSNKVWLLLGAVRAHCRDLANVPLSEETRKERLLISLAKGAHATTQIEGNTLTEDQVLQEVREGLEVPPSKQYLLDEIRNILDAYNSVIGSSEPAITLTNDRIKAYNRLILKNLELEDGVLPGEIRTYAVGVSGYRGAPAEDCPFLLQKLCDWLNAFVAAEQGEDRVIAAIVAAILWHIYIAWIHPFGDGNGRTARLIEFHLLVEAGVPIIAAHLLSDHYNTTRSEYYRQLQRASASGGNIVPFLEYALQGFADGLQEQLALIGREQMGIAWRNHVYESFKAKHVSLTMTRRRHLVLDLSATSEPVALADIPMLSSRLAQAYRSKTLKTVSRDVKFVQEMGLVEVTSKGIRARREIVRGFLPARRANTKTK